MHRASDWGSVRQTLLCDVGQLQYRSPNYGSYFDWYMCVHYPTYVRSSIANEMSKLGVLNLHMCESADHSGTVLCMCKL